MSKIITITINPTIDKSVSVPVLMPDKKLSCSDPILHPGGGGVNVARAVKKLGGTATAIFPAGGYSGSLLKRLLAAEGVPCIAVDIDNDTRENLMVVDQSSNLQYRFGMPGPLLSTSEWKTLLMHLEEIGEIDYIVASGSLSPGVPVDIFAQISLIARNKKAKLVVDTSGEALKLAVKQGVYLLKANSSELAFLSGQDDIDPESAAQAAKRIIRNYKCEVIVVTMGASGAILVTADCVQLISAPLVKKKSTVGAGDSLLAGTILKLSEGYSLGNAVCYGVACGSAATMNPGTGLCNKEDVTKLYEAINRIKQPVATE